MARFTLGENRSQPVISMSEYIALANAHRQLDKDYQEAYDALEKRYNDDIDSTAVLQNVLSQMAQGSEAEQAYASSVQNYYNAIQNAADALAQNGLSQESQRRFNDLRRQYAQVVVPLATAIKQKEELAKTQQQSLNSHIYQSQDLAQNVSLVDLINNPGLQLKPGIDRRELENYAMSAISQLQNYYNYITNTSIKDKETANKIGELINTSYGISIEDLKKFMNDFADSNYSSKSSNGKVLQAIVNGIKKGFGVDTLTDQNAINQVNGIILSALGTAHKDNTHLSMMSSSTSGQSTDGQSTDGQSTDGQSTDGQGANEQNIDPYMYKYSKIKEARTIYERDSKESSTREVATEEDKKGMTSLIMVPDSLGNILLKSGDNVYATIKEGNVFTNELDEDAKDNLQTAITDIKNQNGNISNYNVYIDNRTGTSMNKSSNIIIEPKSTFTRRSTTDSSVEARKTTTFSKPVSVNNSSSNDNDDNTIVNELY